MENKNIGQTNGANSSENKKTVSVLETLKI